jgi:hypothetical protein
MYTPLESRSMCLENTFIVMQQGSLIQERMCWFSLWEANAKQKYWTVFLQGPRLVYVQGLWCHMLNFHSWALLVYRGVDSL